MQDRRNIAVKYLNTHSEDHLNNLMDWITIPSISTDPLALKDIHQAALKLKNDLQRVGIENVEILPTKGHPVVYGEYLKAGVDAPTLLIYGHYDVQPPEPLELWVSPPFQPEVRQDYLYGRGSTDMKGQVMAALNAIEAIIKTGHLPINVKFLIEGEEEIGSPNLAEFLNTNRELLACDFALNPDAGILGSDIPTITYALRGMVYFEIRIIGPDHDLHSGVFGGVVHNPAQALCKLIAGMHDKNGVVTLPGFYDSVMSISQEERQEMVLLGQDEAYFLDETGAPALWGDVSYSPAERTSSRPTLEVNGLYSGFIGEGGKTVLPSSAMAKISMRLVPNQKPDEVHDQLNKYFQANAPDSIRYEIKMLAGSRASISDRRSVGIQALSDAMKTVWGKEPVFKREGSSVPVVALFQDILHIESINTGFSMPSDNMHGPNEKLHLPTWRKGTEAFIHYYFNLNEGKHYE